eukprot:TRINITY_DN7518_c0_g1_i1.p1 TRINITY_DN7518_c0_g1~~TRINITY_DN7518_c0_g1_i1.p1  ORF type:complete len:167 (+),score=12.80 TRINITY_DN7518_c0_g1_i1:22-522(+)
MSTDSKGLESSLLKILDCPDIEFYPCLSILRRLWANLLKDPVNEIYRTLNTQNKKIEQELLGVNGVLDFMLSSGWVQEGSKLLFKSDLAHVKQINELLSTATSLREKRRLKNAQHTDMSEKDRIMQRYRDDRRDVSTRSVLDSVAKDLQFGASKTTCTDLGIGKSR